MGLTNCVIFCSSLLYYLTTTAQELEIGIGPNHNKFFNYTGSEFSHSYGSGLGFNVACGLTNIELGSMKLSIELGYSQYSGNFYTSSAGWTYSESHTASIKNSSLNLSVYALHLNLFKQKFQIKSGLNLSYIVHSQISGNFKWYYPYSGFSGFSGSSGSSGIRALEPGLENPLVLSLTTQFNYSIDLSEIWTIKPALIYQIGITRDYNLEQSVRKMITSFEVIISRKF